MRSTNVPVEPATVTSKSLQFAIQKRKSDKIAMQQQEAKFQIGQLINHLKAGYRGVIYDIDPVFSGTEEWYTTMATSLPPKDRPWYHVLVDGQQHTTYVAERHLAPDETGRPIAHPLIDSLFSGFESGHYIRQITKN